MHFVSELGEGLYQSAKRMQYVALTLSRGQGQGYPSTRPGLTHPLRPRPDTHASGPGDVSLIFAPFS